MPRYLYRFQDEEGGEITAFQAFEEDHLTMIDGRPVKRILCAPDVFWNGTTPALEDFWASGDPADIPTRKKKQP